MERTDVHFTVYGEVLLKLSRPPDAENPVLQYTLAVTNKIQDGEYISTADQVLQGMHCCVAGVCSFVEKYAQEAGITVDESYKLALKLLDLLQEGTVVTEKGTIQ